MSSQEKAAQREVLAEGKFLAFVREGRWEYVERRGVRDVVFVVALTSEGRVLITEEYCPPVRCRVLGLPAGLVGDEKGGAKQEDPADADRRELREETGYEADELIFLMRGPTSTGVTSEVANFFLAPNARRAGGQARRDQELVQLHEIEVSGVAAWLKEQSGGRLVDPKVWTGLYLAGDRIPRSVLPAETVGTPHALSDRRGTTS